MRPIGSDTVVYEAAGDRCKALPAITLHLCPAILAELHDGVHIGGMKKLVRVETLQRDGIIARIFAFYSHAKVAA